MCISIIVAMTEDRVIGRDGGMPWHLSTDLRRFKRLTMTHALIMGRKTYDSIGRPLPGRTTIVISRQRDLRLPGATVVHGFHDALRAVPPGQQAFVVGGASIYQAALPASDQIFRTLVHANLSGDTCFPALDATQWTILDQQDHPADQRNQYASTFQHLVRRPAGDDPRIAVPGDQSDKQTGKPPPRSTRA
jgi:dihydrofolate reductase